MGRASLGRLGARTVVRAPRWQTQAQTEADARIRTADPFITSEVLYQLSYVGGATAV